MTDAPSAVDCSGGGGTAEAYCICDGASLQPRDVTASNVNCVGTQASLDCVVGVQDAVHVPGLSGWALWLVSGSIVAVAGLASRGMQQRRR